MNENRKTGNTQAGNTQTGNAQAGNDAKKWNAHRIVYVAVMAAAVFAVTYFRFPLLGSKVHFANAVCLVSSMLLGPVSGGLAAGIGSGLYDSLAGYDPVQCAITVFSKYLMAFVCGEIAFSGGAEATDRKRNIAACVAGAWSYVALYMLKTYVYQQFVYGYPADVVWAAVASKFPASAINAVTAMVAAPIFYAALRPALSRAGQLQKLRPAL